MALSLNNLSLKDTTKWSSFLDLIYPVGSVYISYTNVSHLISLEEPGLP